MLTIDGVAVTAEDRELNGLVQYAWVYENVNSSDVPEFPKAKNVHVEKYKEGDSTPVTGWIGTVFETSKLKDASGENLNKIPLMVRGKLAQEDVLDEFNEVGIYRSYLVGELHADFLDVDDKEDIATSSRQSVREDDPRYQELLRFVRGELRRIKGSWTTLRNTDGTKTALDIPEINEWYQTLGKDTRTKAEKLFGKINQLGMEPDARNELFAQGVLAFEIMKQRDNLEALDKVDAADLPALAKVINSSAELEAVMYHQIVRSRLAVIEKLDTLVSENEKESFLQEHLFQHLWLLDPGWERAAQPSMEKSMQTAFAEVESKLSDDEKKSRYDIRYQKTSGQHVIVELKRADVLTDSYVLAGQVRKYRSALLKWLQDAGRENEPVAIVCVVGRPLRDWADPDGRRTSIDMMRALGARVLLFDELLLNAKQSYDEYLGKNAEIGRVQRILSALVREADLVDELDSVVS